MNEIYSRGPESLKMTTFFCHPWILLRGGTLIWLFRFSAESTISGRIPDFLVKCAISPFFYIIEQKNKSLFLTIASLLIARSGISSTPEILAECGRGKEKSHMNPQVLPNFL